MKKLIYTIPFIIIILIISPFFIAPILNDIALSNFSKQLDNLKPIQGVIFVEKQSICGKLYGNGNGMDFLACMLVKSDISADKLNDVYNNLNYKPAKYRSNSIVEFEVVPITQNSLNCDFLVNGDILFQKLNGVTGFSKYYALVIYNGGYSADFDIRGH